VTKENDLSTRDALKIRQAILSVTNDRDEISASSFNQILANEIFKVAANAMVGVLANAIIKPVEKGLISTNQVYGSGIITIAFDLISGSPSTTIRRFITINIKQDQTEVLDIYLPYVSPTSVAPKLKMLPSEYRDVRYAINMLIQESISEEIDIGNF
jgi:hypothetical protein